MATPAGRANFAAAVEARGGHDVTCIAAYQVPTTTPTIGLGDAFAGGVAAALAALRPLIPGLRSPPP